MWLMRAVAPRPQTELTRFLYVPRVQFRRLDHAARARPLNQTLETLNMQYIILVISLIVFAVWAPVKVTAITLVGMFVIASVVRTVAQSVAGTTFTYGESLKAMGYSFALMLLATFTIFSFVLGAGASISGIGGLLVLAAFFASYILGFSIGLGTNFGASAIIALISTVISSVLFFIGKGLA